MLVLTRRLNQSIKIGDNVEVTIIEVRGDQVRLGVSAPRDVSVHRKEVYLQIQNGSDPVSRSSGAQDFASSDNLAAAQQPANA